MTAASTAGDPSREKLLSPDKRYSVEVIRNSEDGLVVRESGKALATISTQVGPVDSTFEAFWSSDERYVAINKQRSSRPGGDEMWVVALSSGKVLRQPDDTLWDETGERADAYMGEKHLGETCGKVFFTLTAIGWGKGGLRFRFEAWCSEKEVRYFFDGTVDPLNLRTINEWKVSTSKP